MVKSPRVRNNGVVTIPSLKWTGDRWLPEARSKFCSCRKGYLQEPRTYTEKCRRSAATCNNTLILKMQICSNVTDILGNNLSITKFDVCLCTISSMRNTERTEKSAQLNYTEQEHTKGTCAHTSNIHLLPQFTICVMSHEHPHLVLQLSFQFQIIHLPPLYDNSDSTTFPMPTSAIKLHAGPF